MNNEKIVFALLVAVLAVAVLLVAFSVTGFFAPGLENNTANFQQLSNQENTEDICAVPPGADPVQWKEHLGHHPDKYAQCLK